VYFFSINWSIIDLKEKRTFKYYKLNNNNSIAIVNSKNVIAGP
jgi:hypothetical protein